MAEHLYIVRYAVEHQSVSPSLLIGGQQMDILRESEPLDVAVIFTGLGGQHIAVFPSVGAGSEEGDVGGGVVRQVIGLDEDGVSVHIHIPHKIEGVRLRVVVAIVTFYDLAILVPQGSAVPEHGHAILGVIVQIPGSQRVLVLVLKLDESATELRQILIDQIVKAVTAQDGVVLDDLNIAESVDYVLVDIP